MKHITKDGTRIKLKHLEISHLKNIISMIERKSKAGITVKHGGNEWDTDSIWCDEEELFGEEALKHMNYYEYVAELKRRESCAFSRT